MVKNLVGLLLEIYIKREKNIIGNGAKFTLGNSGGKGTVQYIIPEGKTPITHETQLKVDFLATSLSIVKERILIFVPICILENVYISWMKC